MHSSKLPNATVSPGPELPTYGSGAPAGGSAELGEQHTNSRSQQGPRATSIQWMRTCETILRQYGLVQGAVGHPARHQARYQARRLIQLLADERGYPRAQLREHTEYGPRGGGWIWFVELRPAPDDPSRSSRDRPRSRA